MFNFTYTQTHITVTAQMDFLTESAIMLMSEKGQKCQLDSEKNNQWVCKCLNLSIMSFYW